MREKIIKKLGIDLKTYNDVRSGKYSEWCSKQALHHGINHRNLVKNEVLYNWFLAHFTNMVELPFMNDIQDYNTIEDPALYQDLFYIYWNEVLEYYPGALLNKIKIELNFKRNIDHG